MPDTASQLRIEEYRALRDTIRSRGNTRVIVATITFSAWAAAILITCSAFVVPVFGLVPLLVLAAGFEVVFAIHTGVERIGRYVQVHYEAEAGGPQWEHSAMQFRAARGGSHPMLPVLFVAAALVNLLLTDVLAGGPDSGDLAENLADILVYAAPHALFLLRIFQAFRLAGGQRSRDLAEFERLKAGR